MKALINRSSLPGTILFITAVLFSNIALAQVSDLSITKVDNPDPVIAGTELTYTVTVANAGPDEAAATTVVDTLPAGTTYVSDTAGFGCTPDTPVAGSVSCLVGIIADGGSPSFDIVVAVSADVPHDTVLENEATVSSDSSDPDDTNNTVVGVETTVNREATFDITKTWDGGEVEVMLTCSDLIVYLTTTSGKTAQIIHTEFADGVDCVVTETVPAGYAPTYSADCNVSGVLSGSTYSCDITNAETVTSFNVIKTFSDGNTADVEVTLTCNTGLPLVQNFTIAGGDPVGVNFVVAGYVEGTMDCDVTETGSPAGYTVTYDNCSWDNVLSADTHNCVINNTADAATFTVNKVWEIFGGGDAVLEQVVVTAFCDNPISGGTFDALNQRWYISDVLGDGDSLTAIVDTTLSSANCWAEELVVESGVEPEDDCGLRTIPAGGSSSCTFTNTVFFEGIPTLSQYGLAILALLMLGVGMVGFRRFA